MATASTTTISFAPRPNICEIGGQGVILPIIPGEQEWDKIARGFIYLLMLGWCFLGVAIVSDIFMEAIEAVTSKRRIWRLKNGQEITTKVWNDTVANLSLMALGSSAPEIMLNVVEICLRDFFSGDLGPSTIVGSAAFNLMVIIAVCVMVIPEGESRTIKSVEAFLVTAVFSIFAYVWMVFILSATTPDIVTIPEAIITLLMFPVLISTAYAADVGMFNCRQVEEDEEDDNFKYIQSKVMEAGYDLTSDETKMLAKMKTAELGGGKSWAAARVDASPVRGHGIPEQDLTLGFITSKYCFSPEINVMTLTVGKFGKKELVEKTKVEFEFRTCDGNNMRADDRDYNYVSTLCEIPAGEEYAEITVTREPGMPGQKETVNGSHLDAKKVSQDVAPTNYFYVEIVAATKLPAHPHHAEKRRASKMGTEEEEPEHPKGVPLHIAPEMRRTQVAIAEINGRGRLRMETNEVDVPCPEQNTECQIKVRRIGGSQDTICCQYYAEEDTAKAGMDFETVEDELTFRDGVMEQIIKVPIMKKMDPASKEQFTVILAEIPGRPPILVEGQRMCTGTIYDEDKSERVVETNKVLRALDSTFNVAAVIDNARDWADQFAAAFNPKGGDEEDAEEATVTEWTMHFIALPWKILFAFTPPPSYCGGWLCFFVALFMIGAVTVFIGDLATLIGCVMNINSSITAITIVALGTSLPDTFASKVAAVEDPTADAAIGNVTGSNSVNVFLGLGLPWVIGSIYWSVNGKNTEWIYKYPEQHIAYPNGGLVVLAGDLSFSVATFTMCALTVLGVIWYRRTAFEAELGGPVGVKTNTSIFLVLLWVFYVSMASWKVINGNVPAGKCIMAVFVGLLALVMGMSIVSAAINFHHYHSEKRRNEFKELFEEIQAAHDEAIGIVPLGSMSMEERKRLSKLNAQKAKGKGSQLTAGGDRRGSQKITSQGSIIDPLLQVAPALAEGLRMKMPEAVVALRKHLDALNVVCTSLESNVEIVSGEAGSRPGRTLAVPGGAEITKIDSVDPQAMEKSGANARSGKKEGRTPDSARGGADAGDGEEDGDDGNDATKKKGTVTSIKKKRLKKKAPDAQVDSSPIGDDENQDLLEIDKEQ